ncbi:MAG: class I SAM-dependent methyltransferase [Bacteroidetes bacterium]|nr:MAG: class I SAM-dependent methyltransferase [Bacteroidota bacterium]REK08097.1 MAG: class I SAM-dependent methyltransferase [Bacteroidota bacterium]REK32302.1 MAG: class I SAM-dependent methyltransferase [Bacteroidota bacterium]REK49536.1 MAG: class I SAM-dependent methyltransferase [Bacteroidota bacterium]
MITKAKLQVDVPDSGKEWFETWFDSPYYHILYSNRDEKEAEFFLGNLINCLNPAPEAKILDVACGKGRHAIYLNNLGFSVTGYDLSESNIAHTRQFENERLNFFLHDMREEFVVNYFDVVLNLFSSFGYFDTEHENFRALNANVKALKDGGYFVLDFFNAGLVRKKGNITEFKEISGINFEIEKVITDRHVIKRIKFTDSDGRTQNFEEHLMLYTPDHISDYFNNCGLKIIHKFGNYRLENFNSENSERFILIGRKEK